MHHPLLALVPIVLIGLVIALMVAVWRDPRYTASRARWIVNITCAVALAILAVLIAAYIAAYPVTATS